MEGKLELRLLGGLSIRLDGNPVTGLASRKAEALLVYLARSRGPQRREVLADMLWDERSQSQALSNLRVLLTSLRQKLGDHIEISRETVGLNPFGDTWIDTEDFEHSLKLLTQESGIHSMKTAEIIHRAVIDLYRGDFLEGFYIADSSRFENWLAAERERLHRQAADGLAELVAYQLNFGNYKNGVQYASRLLSLDPLMESAHRQMMRLLVYTGQKGAALEQYETCRRLLEEELSAQPDAATTALYEAIRSGKIDLPTARPGAVRGYELREQIGSGSYGAVYRAYQASVAREVAIKVILPQYADSPDFIRRFESEAQTVARLEHPHIVPLYDYWREPGGAYLVMRLLRGGSLQQVLEQGPMALADVVKFTDQISSALQAAHQRGVIHRDIKPANILFDEAGLAYLSDFGIAKDLDGSARLTQAGVMLGTPLYMSPEQLLGQPITPLADQYSLGVLLHEMLSGIPPYPDETLGSLVQKKLHEPLPPLQFNRPELPPSVDAVIRRATSADPAQRYSSVIELAVELRQAASSLAGGFPVLAPVHTSPELINPFKGLQSFNQADAADFFGREALVNQLISRLTEAGDFARFLAVVGPSGSGKSSVVHAGVLPALRQKAIPGSQDWYVAEMVPGAHPLDELEICLTRISANPNLDLGEQLNRDERGLARAARLCLPSDRAELLLVIDQFEELFTLAQHPTEASRFMDLLYHAVVESNSCLRVLIALRADFYDLPLMQQNFSSLLQKRTEVVIPLTADEIYRAINEPAKRAGANLEAGLDAGIIADVIQQPGALPLLQYTLTELFEQRQDRLLTISIYRSLGGVLGALSRRAEDFYASLSEVDQESSRQLFLRLVAPGEGVEDTRRRVRRTELTSLAAQPEVPEPSERQNEAPSGVNPIEIILERLGHYRLLTFDHDPATREPTVEIAHEALIKEWARLRGWLDENRAELRLQRILARSAADWAEHDQDPSYLLSGSRLQQIEEWSASTMLGLTSVERAYISASLEARLRQQAAEEAQRQREAALERRSRRFLLSLVAVFALAAAVAIGLSSYAVRQSRLATSRELASAAVTNLETNSERSILLAMQAVEASDTQEATNALHQALLVSRLRASLPAHKGQAYGIAYSPDGRRFASAGDDGKILIWEVEAERPFQFNQPLLTIPNPLDFFPSLETTGYTLAFSPDGTRLAGVGNEHTAKIWDSASGELVQTLRGHDDIVTAIAFSPNNRQVMTASADRSIRLWDALSGKELLALPAPEGFVPPVGTISADGKLLVACTHECQIWDIGVELIAPTKKPLLVIPNNTGWAYGAFAFSPDGQRLALGSNFGVEVYQLALDNPEPHANLSFTIQAHDNNINRVMYTQDGSRLITASADGKARVWDAANGMKLFTLATDQGMVNSAAVSPDAAHLVSAHQNGSVGVWDLSLAGTQEWFTVEGGNCVAFSRDGKRLAVTKVDVANPSVNVLQSWDVASNSLENPQQSRVETGAPDSVCGGYTPDLSQYIYLSSDSTVHVWDIASAREVNSFPLFGAAEHSAIIGINPSGYMATGGPDSTLRVWNLASGALLFEGQASTQPYASAFSPDGNRIAAAGDDHNVRIWDLTSGQIVQQFATSGDEILTVAFSPDSKRIVTGHLDSTSRLWDASTGQELHKFAGNAPILGSAFSPDGSQIALGSADGFVKIWSIATGQELLSLPGLYPQYYPDGQQVVIDDLGRVTRGFFLKTDRLMELAKRRATRELTQAECLKYLHRNNCPP
jgi:WD40 repeat protein/serine/threonine protein kinase